MSGKFFDKDLAVTDEKKYTHVTHDFEPVYDGNSRVLILGTMPSVKSREGQFYYHHPQNRFWKLIARLTATKLPETIPQKKEMLLKNGIAIWDVIQSCDIVGSSDSSIRNVTPTDLSRILDKTRVQTIFANGGKAWELYMRYCAENTGRPIVKLPSTSPANAAWTMDRLAAVWGKALTEGGAVNLLSQFGAVSVAETRRTPQRG